MTRRAGLAIAGLLLLMLGLEVLGESRRRDAATYGQGGGEPVCFCITETPTFQMVVSPTMKQPTSIVTPIGGSATPTVTPTSHEATPTRLPTLDPRTPLPPKDTCRIAGAGYGKGEVYVFTDKQQRNLSYQNLRYGPGTQYAVVGTLYLSEQKRSPVHYRYNGWVGLNPQCTIWAYTVLGEVYPEGTE